jgi:hypothetical protein
MTGCSRIAAMIFSSPPQFGHADHIQGLEPQLNDALRLAIDWRQVFYDHFRLRVEAGGLGLGLGHRCVQALFLHLRASNGLFRYCMRAAERKKRLKPVA